MIQEIELTGPRTHFLYNGKHYAFAKPATLFEDQEGADTKVIPAAVFYDEESNYITAALSEVSGIPLTPEMLVNIGFKYEILTESLLYKPFTKMEMELFEVGNEYKLKIGKPFQYVHQLQNLYFDLTGEELQINP